MKRKQFSVEQIVAARKQAEMGSSGGTDPPGGVPEQTLYRRKKQYKGLRKKQYKGMRADQVGSASSCKKRMLD